MHRLKNFLFKNTSTKQTVAKNTFWLITAEVLSRIIRFCLIIYAARILGANGWGLFSYALSAAGLFMAFSDFGLSPILSRERLSDKKEKDIYLSGAFYLKLGLVLISLVLAIVAGELTNTVPAAHTIIPIAALILMSDSLRDFVIVLIRAQEKMEKEAFFRILTNGIIGITGISVLLISPSPFHLALCYLTGSAIGTIAVIISTRKELASYLVKKVPMPIITAILAIAWPMAILSVSNTVMSSIDTIMISWWHSVYQIGLYTVDQRIVQFIYIVPTFFISALFPTLTKLFNRDRSQFRKALEQSLITIFLIGLPIAIGGALLSKDILSLLFGSPYREASGAFIILISTVVFVFPNALFYNAAVILGIQKKIVYITVGGVFCSIIINFLLIPTYGIAGAAAGILFSQLFIIFFTWRRVKKYFYFSVSNKLGKIITAGIGMTLCIIIAHSFSPLIVPVIIGILSYFGILWLLKEPALFAAIKSLNFI